MLSYKLLFKDTGDYFKTPNTFNQILKFSRNPESFKQFQEVEQLHPNNPKSIRHACLVGEQTKLKTETTVFK